MPGWRSDRYDRPLSPSGAQFRISFGDQVATVTEVGATLREYSVGGRQVIDGFGADAVCDGGRGQVLIPWPNRLADGRYRFDGRDLQLPLDEPERSNAIHGLVRWAGWEPAESGPSRVVLSHLLHPRPGYPFSLRVRVSYALDDDGLTVTVEATNLGRDRLPLGIGFHPYLTVGHPPVDGLRLVIPASRTLTTDERGIPTGDQAVATTPYDFRDGRLIGDTVMDVAFGDLQRGEDGRARVELDDPDSGQGVTLWVDDSYTYLMCYTGDSLSDPAARRRAVAVEPMTCPPDALRSGKGIVVLEAKESFGATWGVQPRPAGQP